MSDEAEAKAARAMLVGILAEAPDNVLERVLALEADLIAHYEGLSEKYTSDVVLPAVSLASMSIMQKYED